ncbi:MAG TPA: N-methyl-L-tryptophan oxidase [Thermomicrobiales bacterium]|nr:N-methyl-L-tryptophan oxidase [Thermomicrobiales bacterium]
MSMDRADVIVVGGGTMGTATGWALARQGRRVVVLEQFGHVHALGSHGGRTRIFRHAYAEGPRYVPWTIDADRLWSKVQDRTRERFMFRVGCLDISGPGFPRARQARDSAAAYGLRHEWLTGDDVTSNWPAWTIPGDREVCFDPDAGFLDVANALRALAAEMTAAGGSLRIGERVLGWSADASGVHVTTASGTIAAESLVLTAGAWSGGILSDLGMPLTVLRKPVFWFEIDSAHSESVQPESFPVFISDDASGEFYGIPEYEQPGIKVGMHSGGAPVNPDAIDRTTTAEDYEHDLLPFVQRSIAGATGKVLDAAVCMYTMTPDHDFVIDRHPTHDRVVFATGFSGHGFKFAPVIGELLATLCTDPAQPVMADFALDRFLSTV